MSEEENIHGNPDLSNSEEEVRSTEPETESITAPELEPEREVEIISSVTEKSGVEEEPQKKQWENKVNKFIHLMLNNRN